jgi:hypothetical protein
MDIFPRRGAEGDIIRGERGIAPREDEREEPAARERALPTALYRSEE